VNDQTTRAPEADLLIVGAGAKATAIAAKVHVLNKLGLGPFALQIVEANEPAASWTGRNGMTSGEEPLAIPPIKDVGFPYQSIHSFGESYGDAIDSAMMGFTWQQYMIEKRRYVRWVNAGSPSIQHRTYGHYLAWVLEHATEGVRVVHGRVNKVSLGSRARPADAPEEHPAEAMDARPADYTDEPQADYRDEPPSGSAGERWELEVVDAEGQSRYAGKALALTGPGVHRPFPHDRQAGSRIFHCDSRRIELAKIPIDQSAEIAIVGGGESALSCVAFLRGFRPDAMLTVYTPALPLSRGESFLENRVFSDPDEVSWETLDERTRRDFVRHCDRGVFDPQTLASIAYDEHCRFVTARVSYVRASNRGRGVLVDCRPADGSDASIAHDYVVNCTGFDLLEQLRGLFGPTLRAEIERRVGAIWDRPTGQNVPIGRNLELAGMRPRLYIPGLGAFSQGPGFANLGCLGLLANRVLEPLCAAGRAHSKEERSPIREVV
jgi:mycobactin lysine-N-oxygenase